MTKRNVFLALAVLFLLLAGGVLWLARPVPVVMTVDVTGTPGLPIRGTSEVDGVKGAVEGTIPMHFTLEGESAEFSLAGGAASGSFAVKLVAVFHPSPLLVQASAETGGTAPDDVVRGSAKSGWTWQEPRFGIQCVREKSRAGPPR